MLEDVWSETTTIQQFNPLGKVPCLMMDDGGAMFDSRVISEYLDILTPVGKLMPTSGRERAEVKCWEALADGLLEAAILVRLEKKRPTRQQSPEWIKRQWSKVEAGLKAMSVGLGEKAIASATTTPWRMSPWVARWVGWNSDSLKPSGKTTIRSCCVCTRSCLNANPSRTRSRNRNDTLPHVTVPYGVPPTQKKRDRPGSRFFHVASSRRLLQSIYSATICVCR